MASADAPRYAATAAPVLSACPVPGCEADPFHAAYSLAAHVLAQHLGGTPDDTSEQGRADLRLVLRRIERNYTDLYSGGADNERSQNADGNYMNHVLEDLTQQVLMCVDEQLALPVNGEGEEDREESGAVTFAMPRPSRDVTVAAALSALAQDSPAHSTAFGFTLAFAKSYKVFGIRAGTVVTTPLLRLLALVQHETATDHTTLPLRVVPNTASADVAPMRDLDIRKVRQGRAVARLGRAGLKMAEATVDFGSASSSSAAQQHRAFVWSSTTEDSDGCDTLAVLNMCDRIAPQPSLVVPRRRMTDGRLLCLPHLSGVRGTLGNPALFGSMATLDQTVKVIVDVVSALTALHASGIAHGAVDSSWTVAEVCVGALLVNPATVAPLTSAAQIVEDRRMLVRSLDDVPCLQGRPEVFRLLDAFVSDIPKTNAAIDGGGGETAATTVVTVDHLTVAAAGLDECLREILAAASTSRAALSARASSGFYADEGLD